LNAMALVHEKLYKGNSVETIELKEYIDEVVTYILYSIPTTETIPDVEVTGDAILVHIDQAIPLGLIVNEIITNSFKHAFVNMNEDALISINLKKTLNSFTVTIKDNGKGFPEGFNPETPKSLGTRAIILLSKQIGALFKWYSDKGATWEFQVPIKSL